MAFKMKKPSMTAGTKAHRTAVAMKQESIAKLKRSMAKKEKDKNFGPDATVELVPGRTGKKVSQVTGRSFTEEEKAKIRKEGTYDTVTQDQLDETYRNEANKLKNILAKGGKGAETVRGMMEKYGLKEIPEKFNLGAYRKKYKADQAYNKRKANLKKNNPGMSDADIDKFIKRNPTKMKKPATKMKKPSDKSKKEDMATALEKGLKKRNEEMKGKTPGTGAILTKPKKKRARVEKKVEKKPGAEKTITKMKKPAATKFDLKEAFSKAKDRVTNVVDMVKDASGKTNKGNRRTVGGKNVIDTYRDAYLKSKRKTDKKYKKKK
jgi:hypothetical protein